MTSQCAVCTLPSMPASCLANLCLRACNSKTLLACYSGVDIGGLLAKIGLQVNSTNETVGTFAIAYAAHKALSPVRFPPTVALTPVVAKWLGKKGAEGEQQQ